MPVPSTPTNLYVQDGNGKVSLQWDIMSGATSYKVQRSTDGVTFSLLASPTVNYYLDDTVSTGTRYYYQVAASNGSGDSSYTANQLVIPALTGKMSLYQLRILAQQRADRLNNNFVTLTEWNSYINQAAFELYDLLVTLYEDYYLASPVTFQTVGGTNTYTLPNGSATFKDSTGATVVAPALYKLIGVDLGLASSSNAWVTVKKFDFIQRNRFVFPNLSSTYMGVFNLQYRMMGDNLQFIPTPAGAQYIRLWYIPRMNQLVQDTDILDGVSGWTEYVVIDAAIRALRKEESDTSELQLEKQAMIDRIQSSAMNRDAGQPDKISDTRNWTERWGSYGGPGFDGGYGGY